MDPLDLNNLAFSGHTLNVEERAGLEAAIAKRRLDEGLTEAFFWGKITGAEADYLVVYGFGPSTDFPKKQFYYCTTKTFTLQAFPDMPEEFVKQSSVVSGGFKGDPNRLMNEDEEEEDEEDEDGAPKPKKVLFREAHRLAYVVDQIDAEVSVVPRGAYAVSATHYVIRNTGFGGLAATEAGDLANYFHFREPTALARKTVLERRGLVATTDFLDPISEDTPRGVWALRVDKARAQATLRSLVWPGYFFFHNLGTARFGGAYFGDGRRNDDIGFMV